MRAYHAGDIMPITLAAASYAGLSKDLEFDMSWMTEQDRAAVQKAFSKSQSRTGSIALGTMF